MRVRAPAAHDIDVVVALVVAARKSCYRRLVGMAPPRNHPRIPSIGAAAILALLTACFDSDELRSSNETGESGGAETVTMYNDEESESDDSWTAEETGPAETTCRDAIDCLVTCQTMLILNPMPEPNYECFFQCDAGLNTEEAYLLIKLAECIGNKCASVDPDGPAPIPCGPEGTDNDCLFCIASNGQDPQPLGCIEEAAACQ